MATESKPNAPHDPDHLNDPARPEIGETRSPAEFDQDLQIDPDLAEGPASSTRMALFAVGIAIVLGVVFYGLNNSSLHQQSALTTTPVNTQNSASTSPPAALPAPRSNTTPGTTTGSAPANPQTPSPSSTQAGGANTNNANSSNAPASK